MKYRPMPTAYSACSESMQMTLSMQVFLTSVLPSSDKYTLIMSNTEDGNIGLWVTVVAQRVHYGK